jgi:hypothetical protein
MFKDCDKYTYYNVNDNDVIDLSIGYEISENKVDRNNEELKMKMQ